MFVDLKRTKSAKRQNFLQSAYDNWSKIYAKSHAAAKTAQQVNEQYNDFLEYAKKIQEKVSEIKAGQRIINDRNKQNALSSKDFRGPGKKTAAPSPDDPRKPSRASQEKVNRRRTEKPRATQLVKSIKAFTPKIQPAVSTMPRRRRNRTRRAMQTGKTANVMGGGPATYITQNDPVAKSVVSRNSTYMSAGVSIRHNVLGLQGVRIRGSQPLADVSLVTNGSFNVGSSLATCYSPAAIMIDPDHLNGPIAAQSTFHERYCFRWLKFTYIPYVPTSTPGTMAMSYAMDPDVTDLPNNFAEQRELQNSVTFAIRSPVSLEWKYTGSELWYVGKAQAGSNIALDRQQTQGIFGAHYSAPDNEQVGYINIEYVIELFESVPLQNISAFIASPYERRLIRAALQRFRERWNDGKKVTKKTLTNKESDGFEIVE